MINYIIEKRGLKTYLEIGVHRGQNFEVIKCESKIGVDPDESSPATYHMTSDEFFELNSDKFDCIFIDGLHHYDQCLRDINNSLNCLSENGVIICHDMIPKNKAQQVVPRSQKSWTGDVWKSWLTLRKSRSDLFMAVVNICTGCGVITQGSQKLVETPLRANYENFVANKKEWMNLMEFEEFTNKFSQTVMH